MSHETPFLHYAIDFYTLLILLPHVSERMRVYVPLQVAQHSSNTLQCMQAQAEAPFFGHNVRHVFDQILGKQQGKKSRFHKENEVGGSAFRIGVLNRFPSITTDSDALNLRKS